MKPIYYPDTVSISSLCLRGRVCHYCCEALVPPEGIEARAHPDRRATRDHTQPACDGGCEWVLACHQCNMIKAGDPFELFVAFMVQEGRALGRHARKRAYRIFRARIIALGLTALSILTDRLNQP